MILLVQFGVVGLFAVTLFRKSPVDLEKSKKSLQNMYKNLDTTSKLKLFNTTLFYLTRIAIVVLIAAKLDFGV